MYPYIVVEFLFCTDTLDRVALIPRMVVFILGIVVFSAVHSGEAMRSLWIPADKDAVISLGRGPWLPG